MELWFSINPDGQTAVAEWYRQNLGTPYEVSPMPELYQEYVGHDNNRDGYMLNMMRVARRHQGHARYSAAGLLHPAPVGAVPRAHLPAAVCRPDFRQHAPADGALAEPDRHRRSRQYLDDHGLPGSMHQESFDVWYPGYLDNIGNFRHTISFFTETALYRYATPHFYTVDEFPADAPGLGQRRCCIRARGRADGGGWPTPAATCMKPTWRCLTLAAKYREQMTYNKYRAARDTIERFPERAAVRLRDPARTARRAHGRAADGEADAARHRGARRVAPSRTRG